MASHSEADSQLHLPFHFKSSFVMQDSLEQPLKQKSFVCWKMTHLIQTKLDQCSDAGDDEQAITVYESTLTDCIHELEQLMVFGWEKIHCGKWDQVDSIWRDLYAFSCYGMAGILYLQRDWKECIHTLDLGIMLGHKAYQPALQRLVEFVHKKLVQDLLRSDADYAPFPVLQFSTTPKDEKSPHQKRAEWQVDIPVLDANHLVTTHDANDLDLIRFLTEHYKHDPVLIKQLVSNWPAVQKWKNLEYLRQSAGFRTVPVEIGKVYTDENWTQKLMPFQEFIATYLLKQPQRHDEQEEGDEEEEKKKEEQTEDEDHKMGYLAQHLLFEQIKCFQADFSLPDFVHVGETEFESNGDINCWFGPKGTVTPIHFDPKHNILAQVVGYKYLRIYAPKESTNLYPRQGILHNTSQVDPEQSDSGTLHAQFPKFRSAKYLDVLLEPGDALYLPPKWWHYVKSLSVSFSVSFWFE